MEADAFLTKFITQVDKVTATDADYAELRSIRLDNLIEVTHDYCDAYPFPFLLKSDTLSISSGGSSANAPSDFHSVSAKGGLWDAYGEKIEYADPDKIKARQSDSGDRPSVPDEYSIFDHSAGLQKFQFPVLSAAATVTILYRRAVPTIADSADGAFLFLPESVQRSAVWMGMKAIKEKRDFRTDPDYLAAKRRGIAAAQPGKAGTGQLSSFFGDEA